MKIIETERVYNGFVKVDKVDVGLPFKLEIVRATNSVAFLVHDTEKDNLLFTIQDRAPMIDDTNTTGELMESAAGRFDCNKGVNGLILAELEQELGVKATEDQIIHINSGIPLALSPGVLTERQYLAYVSIKSSQIDTTKTLFGVREEGEKIARRFISVRDVLEGSTPIHDMKTFALLQWFAIQRTAGIL